MNPTLASALASVLARIEASCGRVGRDPATVRLIAVSKTFPPPRIQELLDTGHTLLGENRVQEALSKMGQVGKRAEWHLIGHLQTNKARQAVGAFAMIHSVDSLKLARELDRRAAPAGCEVPILLQVNLSQEVTKHGIGGARAAGIARCGRRSGATRSPWLDDHPASRRAAGRGSWLVPSAAPVA